MRVVQINSVYDQGSTGKIVRNLHDYNVKNDVESYVFYGRGKRAFQPNIIKISNNVDIAYHGLQTRFFDRHGLASKGVTRELIQSLIELSPDIIHLHNIHGYYLNYPILFNYLKTAFKGQVIWTLHDCWAFTGHCAHYTHAQCYKWQSECFNCPQLNRYPMSIALDRSKDNFHDKKDSFTNLKNLTLVTPSQWLSNELSESFLKEYVPKVINNGINKAIFKEKKSTFRNRFNLKDSFIILGVANIWDERKGLQFFFDLNDHLDENEMIVIVGKLGKSIPKEKSNIIHIPRTQNQQELADIYNAADVFLNTSLEDNYPTTFLEAQSCGTPVVTFNTGGCAESLDLDTSKVLTEFTLESIIESLDKYKHKSNASLNYTSNKKVLSMEESAINYHKLYDDVL